MGGEGREGGGCGGGGIEREQACIYVYMCIPMCLCVHACVYICAGIHMCVSVCVYVCMYACMCECVRVCICVYVCVFVHFFFFSLQKNATDDGLYTVHTGTDDLSKFLIIDRWNGNK